MTLAIAVFESPARYGIVADTLYCRAHGGISEYGSKITRLERPEGDILIAAAGGSPATDRLIRHLRSLHPTAETRDALAERLVETFAAVVSDCGPATPNDYPRTGGYLLVVSPVGIVEMDAYGTIAWADHWRAIGEPMYATAYVEGLSDAGGLFSLGIARRCVESARSWISTVGGQVEMAIVTGRSDTQQAAPDLLVRD